VGSASCTVYTCWMSYWMSPRNRGSDCTSTCSLYDIGSFDLFARSRAWPLQYLHVVLIMYTQDVSDEISLHTRVICLNTHQHHVQEYTQMRRDLTHG
jgi:hypothetical protein